jgi:NADH-quinone oxidoreductase subunit M
MLYLYQRTMFGRIENPKNEGLLDLSHREFATFAPLLVLAVWIGLYPSPFLRRLDSSVQQVVSRVNPDYRTASAGRRSTGVGAEIPAASEPAPGAAASAR